MPCWRMVRLTCCTTACTPAVTTQSWKSALPVAHSSAPTNSSPLLLLLRCLGLQEVSNCKFLLQSLVPSMLACKHAYHMLETIIVALPLSLFFISIVTSNIAALDVSATA